MRACSSLSRSGRKDVLTVGSLPNFRRLRSFVEEVGSSSVSRTLALREGFALESFAEVFPASEVSSASSSKANDNFDFRFFSNFACFFRRASISLAKSVYYLRSSVRWVIDRRNLFFSIVFYLCFKPFKVVVLDESNCVFLQFGFFVVAASEGVHFWSKSDDCIICTLVLLGLKFLEYEGWLLDWGRSVSCVHCGCLSRNSAPKIDF